MGMACPLWTTRWEGQVLSPASPSISAFGRSVYNRIWEECGQVRGMRKWTLSKFLSLSIPVVYLLAVPAYFGLDYLGIQEQSSSSLRSLMQIKAIKKPLRKLIARRSRGLNTLSRWKEPETRSWREALSRASQTLGCEPLICQNSWKERETLNLGSPSRAHGWVLFHSVVIHSTNTYWALSPYHVLDILLGRWGYHK